MFKRDQHIHLIGIGGSGMSGIAQVLLSLNCKVTGSDIHLSETTKRLESLGGKIYQGHDAHNIKGADVVVYSSAVGPDNVEVVSAKDNRIPVIPRAEMLAELMRLKYSIAIAGAHGKTTTTSMISLVLTKAGLDPTVVVGGRFNDIGSNARLGSSEYMVAETDESDGSFLKLSPIIAVVTNIDAEHLDFYKDLDEIRNAFCTFMNKVPFYGKIIFCLDCLNLRHLIEKVERRYTSYGLIEGAEIRATNILLNSFHSEYNLVVAGKELDRVKVNIPGVHYLSNSLAAVAVGLELGIDLPIIKDALANYSGVHRRFEIKAKVNETLIIDDYAHHPTEIKATLDTLKLKKEQGKPSGRIIAIFQPHRYSRTKALAKEFGQAFNDADMVIITSIYPAGEKPIPGVDASLIVENLIKQGHSKVMFIQSFPEIVEFLMNVIAPQDTVITLGAGDIWKVGENLCKELNKN
ncbi:MAG: UDP-N-acetylmuramate--L-alanine ligase [bacterium]|nr:UDP-N-acetylmuramate--L-alanine ligase [bacterium]